MKMQGDHGPLADAHGKILFLSFPAIKFGPKIEARTQRFQKECDEGEGISYVVGLMLFLSYLIWNSS